MQFALLALPLTMLAFGLADVNRATVAKQRLQDALDAATLMAARSTATTDQGLSAVAQPALVTNLSNLTGGTLTGSSFHLNGAYIDSTATVSMTPIISNLWMSGNMNITATSEVVRTMNNLEVALVLDNTGSMSSSLGSGGSKISALQTASQNLVNTLYAAAANSTDPNAVKMAVVPFSHTVNVGSTYQNASWMASGQPSAYGTDIFSTAGSNRFTFLSNMGLTWAGCVEARKAPYDVQDTTPSSGNGATMVVPYFAPDEPDSNKISNGYGGYVSYGNNWITNDKTSSTTAWTRLAYVSKYAASNKSNLASGASGTGNFGPNRECGLTSLLRLTTSQSTVNSKLQSMVAQGNTNIAMGLQWGWFAISPNGPFKDGVAYGTAHTDKIIVLLTDGDNTNDTTGNSSPMNSIYTGLGYISQGRLLDANGNVVPDSSNGTTRRDAIDSRELLLCSNMKAQNIIIYTIGVGVSSHSQGVLQQCASGTDHYYDVTDSSQLTSVFNAIAGSIENLRISR
ncbi:MAG TPA: TadE/TadG family type IV pilus assembly protein [Caulobacteraceae bacterium]|nr:TadE/TadG family type IV pilus assembly protein [Caulobacteraceae bacterium]